MSQDSDAAATPSGVRPGVHYTPQRNWMNDPNGLVFHGGRYHLYYQYNPLGTDHANMSWGHATSTDLLRWEEHPVAIRFDEKEQIFSGSVVFDEHNTSGLGTDAAPPLVAIYTSARSDGIQAQSLAVSLDGGYDWRKYEANPVLDRQSRDFRDPKVFRYETVDEAYWVLVAVEAAERRVLLYRSDNLREWEYLSDYGPLGAVGGVWECPDLFPLAVDASADTVKWVLLISLSPGGLAGGSATQYVVGEFDGVRFRPDVEPPALLPDAVAAELAAVDWVDSGPDCYAGVTFSGLPADRRTFIAWMSNWAYAGSLPSHGWRGAMTVARRLELRWIDGRARLCAAPVLPSPSGTLRALGDGGPVRRPLFGATIVELEVAAQGVTRVRLGAGERCVDVLVDADAGRLLVDRTLSAPAPASETDPPVANLLGGNVPFAVDRRVVIVVDSGSVEVFADGGSVVVTARVDLPVESAIEIAGPAGTRFGVTCV